MKLLIVTQKVDVNDDILGFFHGWVEEFSKHCEKLTVICLEQGKLSLPPNVEILSLGKEAGKSRLKYLWRFYKYILQKRNDYDKVFVHMNAEYAILGGIFWRLSGKSVSLWYLHKAVNFKLWLAEKFVNHIFTASKESFRMKSQKIKIVGHGIDIKKFRPRPEANKQNKIIYVGRISRIKNQELLIRAVNLLVNQNNLASIKIDLIGGAITAKDEKYLNGLKLLVREFNLDDYISFIGSVANQEIVDYYNQAGLSVNLCPTGGVDKAVLESMACAVPTIAFNKAFTDIFGEYNGLLILKQADENELAEKIFRVMMLSDADRKNLGEALRKIIVNRFSLENLVDNIIKNINYVTH
ncbi:MAG: glycosyltransferase family 4 protein [Patescibacteria group bacterium]|nr:glycosyltransferase family 4 protein [Patescibacteria group bacterium]